MLDFDIRCDAAVLHECFGVTHGVNLEAKCLTPIRGRSVAKDRVNHELHWQLPVRAPARCGTLCCENTARLLEEVSHGRDLRVRLHLRVEITETVLALAEARLSMWCSAAQPRSAAADQLRRSGFRFLSPQVVTCWALSRDQGYYGGSVDEDLALDQREYAYNILAT